MSERESDLTDLPASPIDPAFAALVKRRARGAMQDRGLLPREMAVPALLLVAGAFYTATSFEAMLRIFAS